MDQILSFFFNSVIVLGLIAGSVSVGYQILKRIRVKFDFHLSLAMGMLVNYFVLICFISLLRPRTALAFYEIVMAIAIFLSRNYISSIVKNLFLFLKGHKYFVLLIMIWLIPFVARTVWLPLNWDEIDAYVPSLYWILENGSSFNPYLTEYTTMPQLAEYFLVHFVFLGNEIGVHLLTLFFGVLSLHITYKLASIFLDKKWSGLAVLFALAIPDSYISYLSIGKIDSINTYFVLLSVLITIHYLKSSRPNLTFVLLFVSIPLAVKYTSWILIIPLLIFLFMNEVILRMKFKSILYFVIPIIVCAPLLVKNHLQVNNPLAPIFHLQDQSTFVKNHGASLPWPDQKVKSENHSKVQNENHISFKLKILLLIVFLFTISFIVIKLKFNLFNEFLTLIVIMAIYWLVLAEINYEDVFRFLWPLFICLLIAFLVLISKVKALQKGIFFSVIAFSILMISLFQSRKKWYYLNITYNQLISEEQINVKNSGLDFKPEVYLISTFSHLFSSEKRLLSTRELWSNFYLGEKYWKKRVTDHEQHLAVLYFNDWSNSVMLNNKVGYIIIDEKRLINLEDRLDFKVISKVKNVVLIEILG